MKISREAKIGSFSIVMLLCLYAGINFLKGTNIFNSTKSYYAKYDNISGIEGSSSIYIKGFKVGSVGGIDFNATKDADIVIKLNVDDDYQIPANSTARIFSDGLMGGKAIEIVLGDSQEFLRGGDTLQSHKDKDLMEVAGSELEFLKQRIDQLTQEAVATMQGVNTMVADNQKSIKTTLDNMSSISGDLRSITGAERENIKTIISDISVLTTTIKNNSSNIDSIIGNLEGFSDSLNNSGLIGSLGSSVSELSITLNKINNQEGTMGKLMGDQALYDSLVSATTNLTLLFEDIKKHPSRYVNISVFGKKSTAN